MPNSHPLDDLQLATLVASKICHDIIGPVGAIYNGIEILSEDDHDDSHAYAIDVIRSVAQQTSARLQFARLAYGAGGTPDSCIDLDDVRRALEGFFSDSKHTIQWSFGSGTINRWRGKLLLNVLACAATTLPRGGLLRIDRVERDPDNGFIVRCRGQNIRRPPHLDNYIADGGNAAQPDAMSIQAYYAWRLASACAMTLQVAEADGDVLIVAVA
ncbi:MAG: histidine phosphotransferase family protein [Hyphomicrobiaceae bacterium]